MRKNTAEIQLMFPFEEKPQKTKTLKLMYSILFFFFFCEWYFGPNPYPVTQLRVNANTQGL